MKLCISTSQSLDLLLTCFVWTVACKIILIHLFLCSPPLPVLLPAAKGQGLQISAELTRSDGQVFYSMLFENNTQSVLDGFMIQFNKNTFGLAATGPLQVHIACWKSFLEKLIFYVLLQFLHTFFWCARFHHCILGHQQGLFSPWFYFKMLLLVLQTLSSRWL